MNEVLKLGLILMVFTAAATSILAVTYNFTNPIIQEQRGAEIRSCMQNVFPEADDFRKNKDNIFFAYQGNSKIGDIIITETKGYGGDIELMIGIKNNKITGVEILNHKETPGLGSRIEDEFFLEQFIGKTYSQINTKKEGGKIDAITSATISSTAVIDKVRETLE